MEKALRKQPAHGVIELPDRATVVELTICAENRMPWIASPVVQAIMQNVWQQAQGWLVGYYMLMPEHLHLLAALGDIDCSLERWVTYWKREVTRAHKQTEWRLQSDHWDTRIRNGKHFTEVWDYIRQNPVRRGLVSDPDDWPFQGVIHDWRWSGP